MKLIFDDVKRLANIDKHGFDFASLEFDFFVSSKVFPVENGRFKAVGVLSNKTIVVVFKPLGVEAVSIISMRVASKTERANVL